MYALLGSISELRVANLSSLSSLVSGCIVNKRLQFDIDDVYVVYELYPSLLRRCLENSNNEKLRITGFPDSG